MSAHLPRLIAKPLQQIDLYSKISKCQPTCLDLPIAKALQQIDVYSRISKCHVRICRGLQMEYRFWGLAPTHLKITCKWLCCSGHSSSAAGPPTSRTMEPNRIHWQMWHREQGGLHLPSHRLCIPSMQVRFQLDNCDSTTHTLSTVPESVEAKRALPCEPRGAGPFSQVTGQFIVDSWR